ncbi:hypothetical protein TrRE_jg7028, partial [Triparma retinervis]
STAVPSCPVVGSAPPPGPGRSAPQSPGDVKKTKTNFGMPPPPLSGMPPPPLFAASQAGGPATTPGGQHFNMANRQQTQVFNPAEEMETVQLDSGGSALM